VSAIPLLRADFGPPPPEQTYPKVVPANESLLSGALANYIRGCFESAKQQRINLQIDEKMLDALRAMRGEYDAITLDAIKQFGGSEVYARITAAKVRGTSALLREIFTASDRPWAIGPTPEPSLQGPSLADTISAVLQAEAAELFAGGQQPSPEMLQSRAAQLREQIQQARKKGAEDAARTREEMLDDLLVEGGFYGALWAALGDIATFPFAVVKGPIVRNKNVLKWQNGKPTVERTPVPTWERCSPFDVYFAPWSSHPQDGYIIHRERVSRTALQALIGLQAYDAEAIRRVLENWDSLQCEWYDYLETERADLEQRESATSNIYSHNAVDSPKPMLSFYGAISGKMLREWGMDASQVPSDDVDLEVFAYLIGGEVIGVTVNPHPAGFKPFYVDSFERIPGSVYGNAIPELIHDVQAVGNAALRAMVNNLAIASGPMGWINEDRIAQNDANATKLWPWKVFRFTDPLTAGQSEEPMKFFQPEANVEKLYAVYDKMLNAADEITTLPRYMQGSSQGMGGAGRTAAGLSMLMEASNRTIKQTVSSIDQNIVEPAVEHLNIFLALTRTDVVIDGDISVVAKGATELMQRETLRMRRIEFLQMTANPIDQQLVGIEGRYNLLRETSRDLGLPLQAMLPMEAGTVKQLQQMMTAQAAMQFAPPQPQGAPGQQAAPQEQPPTPTQGVAQPPSP
jgi:hypothetical protein